MARYKVAPTKTNLFTLRREEQFAREGHRFLEEKRDVLMLELMTAAVKTGDMQKKVDDALKEAFGALEQAMVRMGRGGVKAAALAVDADGDINIRMRQVMGTRVPLIEMRTGELKPCYSLMDTSITLDDAAVRFRKVLGLTVQLAQLRTGVLRLSAAVRKTTRRVNALEKIHLPDYQETIKYINDILENQGREGFFILKLLKSRLMER
ncbi:MAG: V-type ATP synthase subunit D [Candidatus Omnitrophica bacterium]|nr:V-type ATP synthase subunit D [Candidatus Omnitrophota bacterium]MDE2222859.1 V-type ATP synthase subunit D [Candidatus Omnitrophota bacterium]